MIALLLLHTVSQSAHLSGAQRAATTVGRFDASAEVLPPVALGGVLDSSGVDDVLEAKGARDTAHHLFVRPLDGSPWGRNIGFLEGEILTDLPEAYTLLSGAAPQHPGEICVTEPLADQAPLGSTHEFYGGALRVTVTCVAREVFATDDELILAAPGTWSTAELTDDDASLWDSSASVATLWSGGDILPAYQALMAESGNEVIEYEVGSSEGGPVLRDDLMKEDRGIDVESSPWVFLIPLLVLPLVVGLIAGIMSSNLLGRSSETLYRLGIRRRALRFLTVILPVVTTLLGGVAGVLVGLGVTWIAREVMERALTKPLGPVEGVAAVSAIAVLGLAAGAALGGVVGTLRGRRRENPEWSWLRLPRIPWPSTLALGISAALLLAAALWTGSREATSTTLVTGVVLTGAALVVLTPAAIAWWSRGRGRSRQTLLAGRHVVAASGTWVIVLLFGLQSLLASGGMTAVSSSLGTFNASTSRLTPMDEVRIDVAAEEGDRGQTQERVAQLLVDDLGGARSYEYGVVAALTTAADEVVYTVDAADDAAAFLGVDDLSGEERQAFDEGKVLRLVDLPGSRLGFLSEGGAGQGQPSVIEEVAVFPVPEADESANSMGGVMSSAAARKSGLPIEERRGTAVTGLTVPQITQASTAAERLGFNSSWLYTPRPPDVFSAPPQLVLGAWILTGLTLVTALVYSAQTATGLRPLTAGLRAQGLGVQWTRGVAWRQLAMVILWPSAIGVLGGVAGLLLVVALGGMDLDLYVPWDVVGVLLGGTMLSFLLGAVLCQRGVRMNERI